MNKNMEVTADEQSVSRLAYQLWETAGRPVGRDLEFWLAAEAKLRVVPAPVAPIALAPVVAVATPKTAKSPRPPVGKKTWPKPYPNLPKF